MAPEQLGGIPISRIPVSNRACSTPTPTRRDGRARLPAGYLCALADSTFSQWSSLGIKNGFSVRVPVEIRFLRRIVSS